MGVYLVLLAIAGLCVLIGTAFLIKGHQLGYKALEWIGDGCMLAAFVMFVIKAATGTH